ncbi:MAG: TetR/AcrR family transcriptional regulator [Acidimicrobiales bacterium]
MVVFGERDQGGLAAAVEPEHQGVNARIVAGTLRCVSRSGVKRTTLDDIASEAGCSRATIYRAFPGGRDVLLLAVVEAEVQRLLRALRTRLDEARTLEDALAVAIGGTARALRDHDALQYLLANEPGVVLPHLSFDGLDPVLERAVAFLAPQLRRFLSDDLARQAAEWAARLVVLYVADPEAPLDLTDDADVRRLISTYVLPGLTPVHQQEQRNVQH